MAPTDAYTKLREAILEGRYLPSERLVVDDLVRSLGVPRGSVRTAIARLISEGWIEHTPNRGAKVRAITEYEATQMLESRDVLIGFAAGRAALAAKPADVRRLRQMLADMDHCAATTDLVGFLEGEKRLHAAILTLADHELTQRLVASLNSQLLRCRHPVIFGADTHQATAERRSIIEAIASGNGAAAEQAMRTHLDNRRIILRQMSMAARTA